MARLVPDQLWKLVALYGNKVSIMGIFWKLVVLYGKSCTLWKFHSIFMERKYEPQYHLYNVSYDVVRALSCIQQYCKSDIRHGKANVRYCTSGLMQIVCDSVKHTYIVDRNNLKGTIRNIKTDIEIIKKE